MLLAELESRIRALGYRRVYLTTGDRQPEAEAFHTAAGTFPTHRAAARRGDACDGVREAVALSGRLRDAALSVSGRTSFGNPFVGCR